MGKPRVMVALSGGVDSAVAALRLHEAGYDVATAYMKNWSEEEAPLGDCPWEEDIRYARDAAEAIGVPFQVVNFMNEYRARVVDYMVREYRQGLTPNPDVMCNREIKFGLFRNWATEQGFPGVATGHYVRGLDDIPGQPRLAEGHDDNKDQSYFLAMTRREQLTGAHFPIGELEKADVRQVAAEAGLPNATRKDSQGLCFIGRVNVQAFLAQYIPDEPGEIVTLDGDVLGQHQGLHRYTLGQRKGINLPSNADHEFYVVVDKEPATNRLVVAFDSSNAPTLHQTDVTVHSLNWHLNPDNLPDRLEARVRYRDPRTPVGVARTNGAALRVSFDEPQRALASGQIIAFYDCGGSLLGGGVYG